MAKEYVTQKVFCRRMGMSRTTAKKLLREKVMFYEYDRPKGNGFLMDWEANRKAVIKNTNDPTRYSPEAISLRNKKRMKKVEEDFVEEGGMEEIEDWNNPSSSFNDADSILEAEEPDDEDGEFSAHMSKREAEAVKQLYLAKQAKLKFLKDAGILVESSRVIREWEEIAVAVQKAVLAIPDRTCELFASMTKASDIKSMMVDEINHALSRLKYELKSEIAESNEEDNSEAEARTEKQTETKTKGTKKGNNKKSTKKKS